MAENKGTVPKIKITSNVIIDDDKNTNLHYAAALGKFEKVKEEIENEQKIDPENYMGWTPLMMATRNGHLKIVQFLLQNRANATIENKYSFSIILMAVASGNLDVLHVMLKHFLTGGISKQKMEYILSPLSLSILFNHGHVLRYLTDKSFNINAATLITGNTPLMFAAAMSNSTAFNLLLSRNADRTVKNILGQTADNIISLKQVKKENKNKKQPPPLTPLVLINQQSPYLQHPPSHGVRKSSNTRTPNCYLSPNITPAVTPISFLPQVFFPPEFCFNHVGQMMSPNVFYQNELLNMRLNHSQYLSPVPQIRYTSPTNHVLHLPNNEKVMAWFGNMATTNKNSAD